MNPAAQLPAPQLDLGGPAGPPPGLPGSHPHLHTLQAGSLWPAGMELSAQLQSMCVRAVNTVERRLAACSRHPPTECIRYAVCKMEEPRGTT
jgi:hypothetical protein